jgi:hypothetical protein
MSASRDDASTYYTRGSGLGRLIEFLWKVRRNTTAVSEKTIDPADTSLFFDSAIAGDRSTESELLFISIIGMCM